MNVVVIAGLPWAADTLSVEALLNLVHPPAWHDDAACKEHPELSWFPGRGDDIAAPGAVCAGCLVAGECRAWALDQGPFLQGVWGGLSRGQRARPHDDRRASDLA